MHDKKSSLSLSLNTVTGLVLAVLAILAITALIGALFSIFIDNEEEKGVEEGFAWLSWVVGDVQQDFPAGPYPIQLTEDVAIVGFNPQEEDVRGHCNKPHVPFSAELAITRDPLKCPKAYPCLCLCQADFSRFNTKFEYVDCQNAVCVHYTNEETRNTRFEATEGCDISLIFNDGPTLVEVTKNGNKFSFKKTQAGS
jgi:hypothetical protein